MAAVSHQGHLRGHAGPDSHTNIRMRGWKRESMREEQPPCAQRILSANSLKSNQEVRKEVTMSHHGDNLNSCLSSTVSITHTLIHSIIHTLDCLVNKKQWKVHLAQKSQWIQTDMESNMYVHVCIIVNKICEICLKLNYLNK